MRQELHKVVPVSFFGALNSVSGLAGMTPIDTQRWERASNGKAVSRVGRQALNEYGLNEQQERFVKEYMLDYNATRATIRAGYSVNGAGEAGYALLKHPRVSARLAMLQAEESARLDISRERVLQELAKIGFANIQDVADFVTAGVKQDAERNKVAAVASIRVKHTYGQNGDSVEREFKMHDKGKALEQLGKHLGLFTEKVELSGGVQIDDARARLLEKLSPAGETGTD